jgi:hypothetical protein
MNRPLRFLSVFHSPPSAFIASARSEQFDQNQDKADKLHPGHLQSCQVNAGENFSEITGSAHLFLIRC